MRDVASKVDGIDTMPAANYNAQRSELENAVLSADIVLDPDAGPDTDLNMLGKAIAAYANAGNIYQDSGAADAYVLTIASNLKSVEKYYNNMMVLFKAGNSNTGASTVNINALGIKNITLPDGTALSADMIIADNYKIIVYNLSSDRFELNVTPATIFTNIINELTPGAGVTVDGVLLKDSKVNTDVINEKTPGAGVTVDGVLNKNGAVILNNNTPIRGKEVGGTERQLVIMSTADAARFGDTTVPAGFLSSILPVWFDGSTVRGLADVSTVQTLTNKELTSPTLITPKVDVIDEKTPGAGVTVDGVLNKDNKVTASGGVDAGISPGVITDVVAEKTSAAGVTVDGCLIKDGAVAAVAVGGVTEAMLADFAAGNTVISWGVNEDVETVTTVTDISMLKVRVVRAGEVRMSLDAKDLGTGVTTISWMKNGAVEDTSTSNEGAWENDITYDMAVVVGDYIEILVKNAQAGQGSAARNPKLLTDVAALGAFIPYEPV